jgi:D-inositol-3-phosphate glycosyltransferase
MNPPPLPPMLIDDIPRPWESEKDRNPAGVSAFGAGIASGEFLQCLLADGNARSIIILYASTQQRRAYEERLAVFGSGERVRFLSIDDAEQLLREPDLILLSLSSRLPDLAHIRAWAGRTRWVVAGITHALSHRAALTYGLYALLNQFCDHDILACTSAAARRSVQNLLKHISQSLEGRIGKRLTTGIRLPIIPLGVDEEFYRPGDRAEARRRAGLDGNRLVFLCVSRFSIRTKMDPHPLIMAFKEAFPEDFGRPALVFAGDDNEQRMAESLRRFAAGLGLANDILIRPDIERSEKLTLYQAADVFVSPSDNLQETFGCTLLEAMSCGLPVIASDWSGYRDIVHDQETGFLIPTIWGDCWGHPVVASPFQNDGERHAAMAQTVALDFSAIVDRLRQLAASEEMRVGMGSSGRRRVMERFTWRSVIRRHEEMWRRSLELSATNTARLEQGITGLSAYDPVRLFGHYPTSVWRGGERLAISPAGRGYLDGETFPLPVCPGDTGLENELAVSMLIVLSKADSCTLAALLAAASCRAERELMFRVLLRLAKYGFIRQIVSKGEE